MKKILFGLLAISLVLASCKKDEIKKQEEGLKLEGEWQLESVNFLTENANWDTGVEYNVPNYFGHAPSMYSLVLGFDFLTQKVAGNLGNKLIIYNDGQEHEQDTSSDTWYWNYKNDKKGFEMIQINSDMPPYNFSILNIKDVKEKEDGKRITFKAELTSRIPGKSMTNTQLLSAEFNMKKGKAKDNAKITILNEPFLP